MTRLDWDPGFSVGVKQLDEQHKNLLQLINDLYGENPDKSIKRCYVLLNDLVKYAQLHFTTEETLMEQHGYEELSLQQNEHDAFTTRVFELNEQLADKGAAIFPDLIIFLQEWYVSHILGIDKNYKGFFETRGVT